MPYLEAFPPSAAHHDAVNGFKRRERGVVDGGKGGWNEGECERGVRKTCPTELQTQIMSRSGTSADQSTCRGEGGGPLNNSHTPEEVLVWEDGCPHLTDT